MDSVSRVPAGLVLPLVLRTKPCTEEPFLPPFPHADSSLQGLAELGQTSRLLHCSQGTAFLTTLVGIVQHWWQFSDMASFLWLILYTESQTQGCSLSKGGRLGKPVKGTS